MILVAILAFSVLILVHEWGHFWVAKRLGVGVERFSIGFGPKLMGFSRGGTEFVLSALPLGGYVKLKGEDLEEASKESPHTVGSPDALAQKPLGVRMAVVSAGVAMNLFLAYLLMPAVFMLGQTLPEVFLKPPVVEKILENSPALRAGIQTGETIVSVDDHRVRTWEELDQQIASQAGKTITLLLSNPQGSRTLTLTVEEHPSAKIGFLGVEPLLTQVVPPVVGEVLPNGPADKAGLKAGDEVLSVGGSSVQTWNAMSDAFQKGAGSPLSLLVKRGEKTFSFSVSPEFNDDLQKWVVGVQGAAPPLPQTFKRYPFWQAVRKGIEENHRILGMTWGALKRLFTLNLSIKQLGGPIQIGSYLVQASKSGFSNFLYFVAFLSIQLAIFNLLPIPVLDGGYLLFYLAEAVSGRPVPLKIRTWSYQIGWLFFILLFLWVTVQDVNRLWGPTGGWQRFWP